MPSRSQRHLREIQGVDSGGYTPPENAPVPGGHAAGGAPAPGGAPAGPIVLTGVPTTGQGNIALHAKGTSDINVTARANGRNTNAAIDAVSGDIKVATVAVTGQTVTITGVATGTTTITITPHGGAHGNPLVYTVNVS